MGLVVKRGCDSSDTDRIELKRLLKEGGEICLATFDELAADAPAVAFYCKGGILFAVGALKRPRASYRAKVFRNAGVAAVAADFPFELGWVHVREEARGRGLGCLVSAAVLCRAGGANVYCTSRSGNSGMHRIAESLGFVPCGREYDSHENPGETLRLFIRPSTLP